VIFPYTGNPLHLSSYGNRLDGFSLWVMAIFQFVPLLLFFLLDWIFDKFISNLFKRNSQGLYFLLNENV